MSRDHFAFVGFVEMASYVSVPGNGPDSVIDIDDPEPVT